MELGRMAVLADPTGAVFALWQAKTHPGAALLDAPGSLVWTELTTTDTAKAGAFYTGLFGWKAEVMDMPGMPYTVFKRGTASAGGMMARQPETPGKVPSYWLPYINVKDVDATVAKAIAMGGKPCAPAIDVPTVGRLAILADAQGASFAIINPDPKQA
jgi:predicted enzyme related to lactoylglutathione lyase